MGQSVALHASNAAGKSAVLVSKLPPAHSTSLLLILFQLSAMRVVHDKSDCYLRFDDLKFAIK